MIKEFNCPLCGKRVKLLVGVILEGHPDSETGLKCNGSGMPIMMAKEIIRNIHNEFDDTEEDEAEL